jgi:hypothetical protein
MDGSSIRRSRPDNGERCVTRGEGRLHDEIMGSHRDLPYRVGMAARVSMDGLLGMPVGDARLIDARLRRFGDNPARPAQSPLHDLVKHAVHKAPGLSRPGI